MNINVTSKTRGPAKKLLTFCGVDSRIVRTMTLSELSARLVTCVNSGLVTEQQVRRALSISDERPANDASGKGRAAESSASTDEDYETDASGATDAEGGDGDVEDGNGESDGGDADSDANESGDAADSDSDGDSDGESGDGDDGDASDGDDADDADGGDADNGNGDDGNESDDDGDADEDDDVTEQDEDAGTKAAEDAADDDDDEDDDEDEDEDDGEDIKHPIVDRLMKYLAAGENVALVGPAGTGKSFIARQAAELLGADFYTNGAMLSKYDLIGFTDAHGTYHDTPAYRAFVDGGVHCFDELDASAPDAVVAFNGMTDDQPWYTFPNGQQSKHENYVAIACMNTFGNGATAAYVGRHKQDAAAMDRFVLLHVDYDARIEARIAGKHKDILERVRAVRAACAELGITHIVSYRMIKKAVAGREQGISKRDLDNDILFAGLDDGAVRQIKTRVNAATKKGSAS